MADNKQEPGIAALLQEQAPAAYLVEGWHDGKLIAHIPHLSLDQAKATAAVFSQHYTTTKTRPLYAAPPAQPADEQAGEITPGTWRHLKLMMEHSAWDGVLQLSDALANIDEFAAAQAAPAQEHDTAQRLSDVRIIKLMPDYDRSVTLGQLMDYARAIEAAICPPGHVVVDAESVREIIADIEQHIGQGKDSEKKEAAERPGYGTGTYTHLWRKMQKLRAMIAANRSQP